MAEVLGGFWMEEMPMKSSHQDRLTVFVPAVIYTPIALMLVLTLFTVGGSG